MKIIEIIGIFAASFFVVGIIELVIRAVLKRYIGHTPIERCWTFWRWVYASWNYVNGFPPIRHKGFRLFGYSFEKTEIIDLGE